MVKHARVLSLYTGEFIGPHLLFLYGLFSRSSLLFPGYSWFWVCLESTAKTTTEAFQPTNSYSSVLNTGRFTELS